MIAFLLAVVLAVAPPVGGKYAVTVHGPPNATVSLRATGAPRGWVASFCTKTLCSPFSWTMQLDDRGNGSIELQLIRTLDTAPHRATITVRAPDAKPFALTAIR